jgi:3',5'-cyclic-AMP phosphodiesterase
MKSVRLIQFTDTHLLADKASELHGINTWQTLGIAMAHAGARFDAADGVLLTGDLVHDEAGGYDNIVAVFGSSSVPVYCIPGNHDLPQQMQSTLSLKPFQVGGCAVRENWLIVLLDSFLPNSASGRLGPEQLDMLDSELTKHADKHALICLHHHPIKMRSEWLDTVGLEDADAFRNVVARHKNVRGITWGHVHQSLDLFASGVRYMATPSTCAQWTPRSADFAVDTKPPGYRVFELMPDGTIATEVVWVENLAACAPNSSKRQAPAA